METGQIAQTEQTTETATQKLTLAERIAALPAKIKRRDMAQTLLNPGDVAYEFCVVCGQVRIKPDQTGLTCDNPQCLIQLSNLFCNRKEIIDKLAEMAESIGNISDLHLLSEPKDICDKIQEQIENTTGTLSDAVDETTGEDSIHANKSLYDLCQIVLDEAQKIKEVIEEKEETAQTQKDRETE